MKRHLHNWHPRISRRAVEGRAEQPMGPHGGKCAKKHAPTGVTNGFCERNHPRLPVGDHKDRGKRQAVQAAPVGRDLRAEEELDAFRPRSNSTAKVRFLIWNTASGIRECRQPNRGNSQYAKK